MLNLPGFQSTAAIVAELRRTQYGWETMFRINDCDRAVNLGFSGPTADEDEWANDLHKLDTMTAAIKAFRKGLVQARRREGLPL